MDDVVGVTLRIEGSPGTGGVVSGSGGTETEPRRTFVFEVELCDPMTPYAKCIS